ncbi:MAG: hypothetical protein ACOC5T_05470 [Elusimicrobiota bacterium]
MIYLDGKIWEKCKTKETSKRRCKHKWECIGSMTTAQLSLQRAYWCSKCGALRTEEITTGKKSYKYPKKGNHK